MMTSASMHTEGGNGQSGLNGLKIFIFGAGSGMGAAIAKMAAARGAKIALAGRNLEKLKSVAQQLGQSVIGTYSVDLADQKRVEEVLAEHGPYDHIVTTAAELTFTPFVDLSDEQISRMLSAKFWGPINIGRAASRHLNAQGSVLFFSGLAAYRQAPGASVVGVLNIGLESLAAALAIELKPKRFNVISPGVVDADTWAAMPEDARSAFFQQVSNTLPVGRVGSVTDAAHAALAVLENGFINGTVINVDGGGRVA
ncbi:SDR family oxidoreductase [Herbaspirillum frisingense]|uniref:SDR family oxidoreductase n=1 Tax=Herbaspirillum frisingense TaxID=92645 RepID=UPI001F16D48B|nr:SDR family oxidoreductase [Herbaspirillum frisingense]UIN21156.1 SDR family oxidoreductase [Herbaspirillum frisingense]